MKIGTLITIILLCSCIKIKATRIDNFKLVSQKSDLVKSQCKSCETTGDKEENFYSYFVENAPKYGADYDSDYSPESIWWLDEKMLETAASFYNRNFIGVSLSTLYSGLELFAIMSTTSVLMCSGTVSSERKTFIRVLRTAGHMQNICSSGVNVFHKGSPGYNSLEMIRHKHKYASLIAINRTQEAVDFMDKKIEPVEDLNETKNLIKALKADLDFVDTSKAPTHLLNWDSTVPVSQFDLAMVQFIIFSHIVISPQAFGIYLANSTDIEASVHQAAIIGRIIGIEDRFNVALNLPPEQYREFYKNTVVASFKNVEVPVLHIMANTMEGMSKEFPMPYFLTLKCWLHHAFLNSVQGYKGRKILELMTFTDRICLALLKVATGRLNSSTFYGNLGRKAFNSWFRIQKKNFNVTI